MILFWLIEIAFIAYTVFSEDGLINNLHDDVRFTFGFKKIITIIENIALWFFWNVLLAIINVVIVFCISFCAMIPFVATQPKIETEYSFNINAMQDNMTIEGRVGGSIFGARGYVNEDLSYFYARTMPQGEIIGHLPAKKTYIRYDNNVHPNIEVHQSQYEIPEWVCKVFWLEMFNEKTTDYYVIIAPEGTITNDGTYQIDMK